MSIDIDEQYSKIYKYCYFKLGNASLAEDLTQETFLRYFSQSTYIDRGKGLAYLYTIAKNLCIDTYKAKSTAVLKEEHLAPEGMHNVELQIAVRQALKMLTREEQELLLLRYANEVSVGEICGIMGMSRFSVYRRITAALAQLKTVLREEDFLE